MTKAASSRKQAEKRQEKTADHLLHTKPQHTCRSASQTAPSPAFASAAAAVIILLLAAALLTGAAAAASGPAYKVSTIGMENVVHYNNESHIAQGTPYITIPFNITLGSGEIARGFFIKEDDSASTQAVLNKITDVKLAYSGWNEARSTDNAKIAASSLTAEEFFGTSNTAFIVNLSTKDLTPAASPYKLGFTIDTAWSSKTLETAAVNDWKNAECKAAFTFIIEGQKTIRYDANGGTGSMETQTCASNGTVALSKNNFTRTGYDFIHWNTKPDGTGTSYSDEAALTVYTDTTLYAQWALIGKSSIYGTITNASKDAPVTLTLTKTGETGSRTETVPAGNTSYTIKNVEPGIYNCSIPKLVQ